MEIGAMIVIYLSERKELRWFRVIRQTVDGKLIYKDEVWLKMLETGNKLLDFGYIEALYKPNLFYKKIYKENGEYELLFADLRGNLETPIWKILRISLYPKFNYDKGFSCNSVDFGFQIILLERNITIPVVSSLYCYEEPDGFCKVCNKDILLNKDLNQSQDAFGLVSDIELFYCDNCKFQKYDDIREAKLCFHCKERDWAVEHHINYYPERTILICHKCHSGMRGIHWWGFPNLLWKQTRNEFKELKRKKREEQEAMKPIIQYICKSCGEEVYTTKKSYKCPNCNRTMKKVEKCIANFHCPRCLKSWRGVSYQDYCLDCGLKIFPNMSEEDKKILRFNIQNIEIHSQCIPLID